MPNARKSDPTTSFEAAASVTNLNATKQAIIDELAELGPQIDEDLVDGILFERGESFASESGIRSRRAELVRAGLVVDSGERRKMASGRSSIVWKLAGK
jgi:hypothetical protein